MWPFGEVGASEVLGLALAVVRDMRERRVSASAAGPEDFETDPLAGFAGTGRPTRRSVPRGPLKWIQAGPVDRYGDLLGRQGLLVSSGALKTLCRSWKRRVPVESVAQRALVFPALRTASRVWHIAPISMFPPRWQSAIHWWIAALPLAQLPRRVLVSGYSLGVRK